MRLWWIKCPRCKKTLDSGQGGNPGLGNLVIYCPFCKSEVIRKDCAEWIFMNRFQRAFFVFRISFTSGLFIGGILFIGWLLFREFVPASEYFYIIPAAMFWTYMVTYASFAVAKEEIEKSKQRTKSNHYLNKLLSQGMKIKAE
jgi:hypothetical protein